MIECLLARDLGKEYYLAICYCLVIANKHTLEVLGFPEMIPLKSPSTRSHSTYPGHQGPHLLSGLVLQMSAVNPGGQEQGALIANGRGLSYLPGSGEWTSRANVFCYGEMAWGENFGVNGQRNVCFCVKSPRGESLVASCLILVLPGP